MTDSTSSRRLPLPLLPEVPRPAALSRLPWAPWLAVAAVCVGAFMGQLDASIVTLAFPHIEQDFHASLAEVQWVSLSYLIVVAVTLVPVGRLSDRYGRKRLYVNGFALFALASVWCALSPTLGSLILARAVQAAGAALYQANSVAIVTSVSRELPGKGRLTAALGVQAAAQAAGLALGPTVGGFMVEHWGWESVFWINVPIGILGILVASLCVPRSREYRTTQHHDGLGTLLLAIVLMCTLVVLSITGGLPVPWWQTLVLVVLAFLSTGALVWQERRCPDPVLPLSVIDQRGLWGLGTALAGYFLLFSPLVAYPQLAPSLWPSLSLSQVGLVVAAVPGGFALCAVGATALPHCSTRSRMFAGTAALAVGTLAVTLVPSSPVGTAAGLGIFGAGLGLLIPANNAAIMGATPPLYASVMGGTVNMARSVGTSMGVAAATLTLHLLGSQWGLSLVLLVAVSFTILGVHRSTWESRRGRKQATS